MNKQIRRIIWTMLIVASSHILTAQTSADKFMDTYFSLYEKSPDEAFDFLTKDIRVHEGQETTENMKKQILFAASQSGTYYGFEKIAEKSIVNTLKLMSFLIKHEKNAVRLTTVFYKPADKWILFEYQFDTNLVQELKDAAKLNSLQN